MQVREKIDTECTEQERAEQDRDLPKPMLALTQVLEKVDRGEYKILRATNGEPTTTSRATCYHGTI